MGLPTSEAAVREAEQQLGRTLPAALRERLLRDNGGDVLVCIEGEEDEEWQLHPVWDASDRETMRRSSNHIVAEQESARAYPDFPDGAISIAQYDGDQLVLLPDDDVPRLWLHETGDVWDVQVVWEP